MNADKSTNEIVRSISNLDGFYSSEIIGNYKDIRTLSKKYSKNKHKMIIVL